MRITQGANWGRGAPVKIEKSGLRYRVPLIALFLLCSLLGLSSCDAEPQLACEPLAKELGYNFDIESNVEAFNPHASAQRLTDKAPKRVLRCKHEGVIALQALRWSTEISASTCAS